MASQDAHGLCSWQIESKYLSARRLRSLKCVSCQDIHEEVSVSPENRKKWPKDKIGQGIQRSILSIGCWIRASSSMPWLASACWVSNISSTLTCVLLWR